MADLLDLSPLSPLSARERVLEVRVEAPGSVDDVVVTFSDGHLDYQSVKLSLRVRNEAWSGLWNGLYAQMRSPSFGPTDQLTIVLSDRSAASDALIQLCDRASSAIDCSEFTARVMQEHRTALESIEELIGDRFSVFELLRRTRVLHLPDDATEREFGRRRLAGGAQDLPALLPLLRDMVGGVSRRRGLFRAANLRRRLQNEYGVLLGEPNEWGLAAYRRSLEQTTRLNVPGKARKVLTSNDPEYRQKLSKIQGILGALGEREGFFSIDEYGPFAVKQRQGRKLVPPDERFTVPQFQKSKGALIMTAALELSTNQVTHLYSKKRNTEEMIKLLDLLRVQYSHLDRIFLSWDAASWHISKKLRENIEHENARIETSRGPTVALAPLPAGAQFLNVIEAVFSGMSRAVIHNSNYATKDEAKAAIDRYFLERNEFFQKHPKRAGNKIWGKERSVSGFSDSNNCKDPRYR